MRLWCYLLYSDTADVGSDIADVGDLARKSIQNLSIMAVLTGLGKFWPADWPRGYHLSTLANHGVMGANSTVAR
jgi:hypothetical protein